jgi:hypothetical protein
MTVLCSQSNIAFIDKAIVDKAFIDEAIVEKTIVDKAIVDRANANADKVLKTPSPTLQSHRTNETRGSC